MTSKAYTIFQTLGYISDGLLLGAAGVFVIIAAFYLFKLMRYRPAVAKELHSPIKLNFFPTVSISLILLSIATLSELPGLSRALWVTGTVAHLLFTLSK